MNTLKGTMGVLAMFSGLAISTIIISIPGPANHRQTDWGTFLMLGAAFLILCAVGLLHE